MDERPSAPLVTILREAARKKGWNTSALAAETGLERGHLKRLLAGREPMLVDEMILLSNAMQLDPSDMGVTIPDGAEITVEEPPEPPPPTPLKAIGRHEPPPAMPAFPDLDGVQAEQIFRLGFMLGCDLLFVADTAQLSESGVPAAVLQRYRENLPIRLDAAYHRHYRPEYFPVGVELRLSFDAVYTCLFPWAAIRQVTLFPFAPDLPDEDEPEETDESGRQVGHLRVIE